MKCANCVHRHSCTQSVYNCTLYEFDMNTYKTNHRYDYDYDNTEYYENLYESDLSDETQAYWIPVYANSYCVRYVCSECRLSITVYGNNVLPEYCEHCGSKIVYNKDVC